MSSRHKFCREPCPVYQVTRNEQHTSYGFHATVAAMSQGLVDLEDAYEQYAYCTQWGLRAALPQHPVHRRLLP